MITHFYRGPKDLEFKVVHDTSQDGVWTHLVNPTDEEIAAVVTLYSLDATIIADARDFFEVPRMERSGGASYYFTRYPYNDAEEDIDTAPLLIVVGESVLLTMVLYPVPQFKDFIAGETEIMTTQKAKCFLQMMNAVNKSYDKEVTLLRRGVYRNKSKLRNIGSREIQRLVNYEHRLNDMISALIPTNVWLQQVSHGNYMQLHNEDIALMNDLLIANNQLVDSARSVLKTIQNIRQATESILTSNLNYTIRTLTIVTILLTIPTLVSSLYGMNVPLPFADSEWSFYGVSLTIFLLVGGVVFLFKRYRWL